MSGTPYPEFLSFHAGVSNCPICGRQWIVKPWDDCLMPACGCYGDDASETNHDRPCEACGIAHAMTCTLMPGREGTNVSD